MSLKDQILNDYKNAMKQKDELTKSILNYIISQMRYKRIEVGRDLNDDEVIGVIKKEIKARKEAADLYTKSGNEDMAKQEQQVVDILAKYLPQPLTQEQLVELVDKYVAELGIEDLQKQRGQLIGAIMKKHWAVVDPALLNQIIQSKL